MRILATGILSDFKGRIFLQQDSPTSLVPVNSTLVAGSTPVGVLDRAFREETGLVVMPVRLTGIFYDGNVPDGELTFCFRCTMRGGNLTVPDGGRPAGFFDYPPLPDGLSPKFRQPVESALHHPGGPPDLMLAGGGIAQRLGRLFGSGELPAAGAQWRVGVRVATEPAKGAVEWMISDQDEGDTSTLVVENEPPWAAAKRLLGTRHQSLQLRGVDIDAVKSALTLVFFPNINE